MSNSLNEVGKHHIFLAYHGDDKTGSQKEAENIYRLLKSIYQDKIDIYFHPISSPNSSYHDTPKEVIKSSSFILVAKNNIPVDEYGMIKKENSRNELSDLYQEVDNFYEIVYKKHPEDNKTRAKVIRVGDLKEGAAEEFYFNMFKSENYSYEEIMNDFENSLFYKNWFSRTSFFKNLFQDEKAQIEERIIKPFISTNELKDGMYENDYLLQNGYTVDEISERHVYLDNICVDKNKFPEAMDEEVEGDAEKWKEMISDTADCSVNLIINNEIVGYMDFIPVYPETYDDLKTTPFSAGAVAFYKVGGDYDIFGSMFSIDINYAQQKYFLMFFDWMIKKIVNWKKEGIFINRIMLSIYSNSQAKALEQLGFIKILENQLKGMLYEITVENLFRNRIVKAKLLPTIYECYDYNIPHHIINECKEIALSHSVQNGGFLRFLDAVDEAETLIAAKKGEEVVGYIALKTYEGLDHILYVEQIAVKKDCLHKGIGKVLVKEALTYARNHGYENMYAHCHMKNYASYELFNGSGFKKVSMDKETYLIIGFKEEDVRDTIALSIDL